MKQKAFSIIEIAVAITIIGVLVSIGTFAFITVQKDSRDAERSSKVLSLAEQLEKYYEQHGEYPNCSELTSSPSTVRQGVLPNLSEATLKAPNASVDNSVACNDITSATAEDVFAYIGSNDNECNGSGACKKFTLKYKKESNGEIISIESRRTVEDIVLVPTLTATATGLTSASATWTAVAGATGYELQRSTSASFTSPTNMTFTTLSESLTSLTPGTTYHLRVRATLPSPVSFSDWSVPVNVTTMTLSDPNGTLAIAAAMSGTSAQGTASGATCVSGSTTEYQIRNNTNGGSWSGYISGAVQDVTSTTEGHEYEFQARARCVVGASQSDWVSGATTASVIRPVTAPSGLLVSSVMSGTNAHGTASGGSCAAGTTIERQLRYNGSNTAASGVWSGWTNGTSRDVPADQGYRYTFQQQARCVGARANSEYAMGGTGSVIRPLVAPGAPSVSPSTNGQITTYARSNLTCASGAYIRYQYRFLADWGYDSGWNGPTTSATVTWNTNNQGYNYRVQWRGECYNTLTASGYGAANEGSYIRPVDAPGAYTYSH